MFLRLHLPVTGELGLAVSGMVIVAIVTTPF
jgi:hypothetical protein